MERIGEFLSRNDRKMNEEIAVKSLREVKQVLDTNGIRYWLDFGALLGAVRDGRIIEWDDDIDLGMADDDWEKIVSTIPEFMRRGFSVHHLNLRIYNDAFRKKAVILTNQGCRIAFMVYEMQGEYALHLGLITTNPITEHLGRLYRATTTQGSASISRKFQVTIKIHSLLPSKFKRYLSTVAERMYGGPGSKVYAWVIPRQYFEQLGTIEFYGMTFYIPSPVEDYLKCHYGNDWKTPKKGWNSSKDDGTIRVIKRHNSHIR